ncbi:iron ABC transporter permease [Psychrobacillus sp. BL-248-WT-3]|uniref:FecCD family ABC transporter permease n=1 Tax=Psychrobacillus sp. BL-248-WT-3 TaxID=2725306 RepID=UPI001F0F77D4|nr:iron ABC transporter permease [Psychrobacillus sp. BL-248-WT-3]
MRKVGFVLLIVVLITILYGLNTGSLKIAPFDVIKTLLGQGTDIREMILFDYRLPRICITVLAGFGLGVAGAIFQGITRNPLADPGVLGIHAGAGVGLMIYMTYFTSLNTLPALTIPLFTFAGGIIAATLIMLFAYEKGKGLLPNRLLLVGIAIAAGFNAVTLYLSLQLAMSIGTRVNDERIKLLGLAVALSCASVAMTGGIGFIGLVAPHIARRLVGPAHEYLLPISGLVGVVILVLSDTIARSIFEPSAIPAGVIVSAIGAPYFLYLLFKAKKY